MNLLFVPKQEDKAYVSDRLWLPKKFLNVAALKGALEFSVPAPKGQRRERLWEETAHHLLCPREFLPFTEYPRYGFPFVDLRPNFGRVEFEDLITPRDEDQRKAVAALLANDTGILNLACGKGKTKLSLKKIAQMGTPTLVIVPDSMILQQWQTAIMGDKKKVAPGLRFEGKIGIIQEKTMDWERPIVLAQVTTLWRRIEAGTIPEGMYRYFGFVLYDECHQMAATKFNLTARNFYGNKMGLTATVNREDGLDSLYVYNIGRVFYSDLVQELIPDIHFMQTPVKLDQLLASRGPNNITNMPVLRTMLGRDMTSNTYRYWAIKQALDAGRKILCLSHSKDQLRLFHSLFPDSALIISETDKDERLDILRKSQIAFAIARLGATGVDDDAIDTIFWLTPFRSKITLQQSMGRSQRRKDGKKKPKVVFFEDWTVPSLRNLCGDLKAILREWGYKFQVNRPESFPDQLPAHLMGPYSKVYGSLEHDIMLVASKESDD